MKKILSIIASAIICCSAVVGSVFTAYADDSSEIETEDVVIDAKGASEAENWGQSLSVEQSSFNAERMTKDSKIVVTYELKDINEKSGSKYAAELIFQSWENTTSPKADADGNVWAKIAPVEFDDTTATYDYESIATAYGTNDFSQVMNIFIGATDRAKITCTGMTITNCKTETYVKAEKKAAEGKTNPVVIIVAVAAGIGIAVAVILIIMNKKSSEAFDVSTGEFIDKKKLFDKKEQ